MSCVDYEPKSILLTGGAGFIGSHLLVHLVSKYPATRVTCLDKLDYCASMANFSGIVKEKNFKFVKGDIVCADLVNHIIRTEVIDTIIHMAAQTHVDNSFGNSLAFTESNVLGTHVLLEATKLFISQVRRFIHVSTDEVYGQSSLHNDANSFDESSALNPTNPYAASKVAAEFLVKAYRHSFNLPTIITRGNNVYGPHQYPEKLIPKFINQIERGQPCTIHGNGLHRRSFLFVDDVVRAFDIVLRRASIGHIYNIGTDFEISNIEVAHLLLSEYGLGTEWEKHICYVEDRSFNDVRYHISVSKLHALGWKPKTPFIEGLKQTISWYKEHNALHHWGLQVEEALLPHPRAGTRLSAPVQAPLGDVSASGPAEMPSDVSP